MVEPVIITLHGINVERGGYADPMIARWPTRYTKPIQIEWHKVVREFLIKWRGIYIRDRFSWNPLERVRQQIILQFHECSVWLQAYDEAESRQAAYQIIKGALESEISAGANQFVFVAHSLGSVVLIDTLNQLSVDYPNMADRIKAIITMGSPLQFWRSADYLEMLLKKLSKDSQWINIHATHDPIAAKLGFLDNRIEDMAINLGNFSTSHIKYWQSEKIAKIIEKFI